MADAELDSVFDDAKEIPELKKKFGTILSITRSIKSISAEDKTTDPRLPTNVFYFDRFDRDVYCDVTSVWVQLIQTGEGTGYGYLTFDQACDSRRSDEIDGWDWHFVIDLYTANNFYIRSIFLGNWSHVCGKKFVELKEDFTWQIGSINPVVNAKKATLHWQHKTRVHNCG